MATSCSSGLGTGRAKMVHTGPTRAMLQEPRPMRAQLASSCLSMRIISFCARCVSTLSKSADLKSVLKHRPFLGEKP